MTRLIVFCTAMVLVFGSCQKHDSVPAPSSASDTTVYISGTVVRPSDGAGVPCYWKNGQRVDLDVPANAFGGALGIVKKGTELYVTGTINLNGIIKGVTWKNGVMDYPMALNGQFCTSATGIVLSGNDLYMSGTAGNTPCYWKNGVPVEAEVLEAGKPCFVNAIAVSGTDVYMTGFSRKGTSNIAVVWKNGRIRELPAPLIGTSQYGVSVAVSGTDVYVAGNATDQTNSYWQPVLWKNDQQGQPIPVHLAADTRIEGRMEVVEGAIYSTGYYRMNGGMDIGAYWKNELFYNLQTGLATPKPFRGQALKFINNKICIAGFVINDFGNRSPLFWKDGVLSQLPVLDTKSGGYPFDIYVGN